MIEQQRPWLKGVTWDSIVGLNRTLCQAQKIEALINAQPFASCQQTWEQAGPRPMGLIEALMVCRRAREGGPFTFNNGNTFAAVARGLVDDSLRNAPAVEAQIIRTTIGHYVAGTIGQKELQQVLSQLAPVLEQSAPPVRVQTDPAPAPAPAPRLTEAARRLA